MIKLWYNRKLKTIEEVYNDFKKYKNHPKFLNVLKELIEIEKKEN